MQCNLITMLSPSAYNRTVTYLLAVAWLTSIVAMLRAEPVVEAVVSAGHSICGPWGCGPPLSSLLVWHGFVTILLVPSAMVAARNWPDFAIRWARPLLMMVGLATISFAVTNLAIWWHSSNGPAHGYVIHRALFSLVAFTDAPIVPSTLAAGMYWWMSRRHRRTTEVAASSTNDNLRTIAEQVEDFGDVTIGNMDAAS